MTTELEDAQRRRHQTIRRFGRDLGINVLANLIAGAIGLLLAQAVGVLKPNRALTVTALLILALFAAVGAGVYATLKDKLTVSTIKALLPAQLGASVIALIATARQGEADPWIVIPLIFLGAVANGYLSVVSYQELRRGSRLMGLIGLGSVVLTTAYHVTYLLLSTG